MSSPLPSNGVSQTTRGLRRLPRWFALPLDEVVARLTEVARAAYERRGLRELPIYAVRPYRDVTMAGVVGDVYGNVLSDQERWEAYRADYLRLTEALKAKAARWIPTALDMNRSAVDRFAAEVFAGENPRRLSEAARVYEGWMADQHRHYTELEPGLRNARRVEVRAKRLEVEREALERADSQHLRVLFGHPNQLSLFEDLADSEENAREALVQVLAEAREGITDFGQELQEDPERFWRYPPIVLAALRELALGVDSSDSLFVRFLLDVARHRSTHWWDLTSSVAGIALVAAAFVVTGGWGAVLIGLVDLGSSGFSAYRAYLDARENEMGVRAGVFGQGQALTDRPIDYGPAVLEIAAALVTGLEVVAGGLKVARETAHAADALQETAQQAAGLSSRARRSDPATGAEARAAGTRWTGGRETGERATAAPGTEPQTLPQRPDKPSVEPIEPPAVAPGEEFIVERLTDNRVGEVKTRRVWGSKPKRPGGWTEEGFPRGVEPSELPPADEAADVTGAVGRKQKRPDWLETPEPSPRGDPHRGSRTRAEQLEGIDERVLHARRASTAAFEAQILRLVSNPKHPLHFLVVPVTGLDGKTTYAWRTITRITKRGEVQVGRLAGPTDAPVVWIGHQGSFYAGAPEQFMLEDANLNYWSGTLIERHRKPLAKWAVLIEGVPVDLASALTWERWLDSRGIPFLSPGTVDRSLRIPPPPLPGGSP